MCRSVSKGEAGVNRYEEVSKRRASVQAISPGIARRPNSSSPCSRNACYNASRVADVHFGLATLYDPGGVTAGQSTGMRIMSLSF
jgi:hypothetical protein